MKRRHRLVPSSGFLLLLMSYASLVSFLAWGYSRPKLDRAWYILQKMQRDEFDGLDVADARMLESLLHDSPRFAHALIGRSPVGFVEPADEGWVSLAMSHLIVQTALPETKLVVECSAARTAYPVIVTLKARNVHQTLEFSEDSARTVDWSNSPLPSPAWVQVSVEPHGTLGRVGPRPKMRIRLATAEPKEARP